jgi:hypothetical protein
MNNEKQIILFISHYLLQKTIANKQLFFKIQKTLPHWKRFFVLIFDSFIRSKSQNSKLYINKP